MDQHNRISPISIAQTTARQTPNNDFGTVLARTVGEVVRSGVGIMGGVAGGPVLSAAVSGVQRTLGVTSLGAASGASPVSTAAYASGVGPVGGPIHSAASATAAGAASGAGTGGNWDLLEAQRLLQKDGQSFNVAYLQLQNSMQQESREHNAISNIMKVRHDSAKAAINNIR